MIGQFHRMYVQVPTGMLIVLKNDNSFSFELPQFCRMFLGKGQLPLLHRINVPSPHGSKTVCFLQTQIIK